MIRRIVLLRLSEPFQNPTERETVAETTRAVIPGLPRVRAVYVGLPADERTEGEWDICIEVCFDTMDDVPVYIADPTHRDYVDEFLKPRLAALKAWNFDVS